MRERDCGDGCNGCEVCTDYSEVDGTITLTVEEYERSIREVVMKDELLSLVRQHGVSAEGYKAIAAVLDRQTPLQLPARPTKEDIAAWLKYGEHAGGMRITSEPNGNTVMEWINASIPLDTISIWCWDADNPDETQADSPGEFAENHAAGMEPGDVSEVTVLCAHALPKRRMRVVVTNEIDGERRVKWEWLP